LDASPSNDVAMALALAPRIAIIWLNYNSMGNWDLAKRSLLSINECSVAETEIYVVDNASTDGSYERLVELVSQRRLKGARLIRSDVNVGYAGGNNAGYKHIGSSIKYMVLMNNDFIAVRGALDQLISFLEDDPKIGAIHGKIVSLDAKRTDYGSRINEVLEDTAVRRNLNATDVTYTPGCFSAYKLEAIRKVANNGFLFMPALFSYGDDDFLGLKLWEAGYKCISVDIMTGYHKGLGSFAGKMAFQHYLSNRAWLALLAASNSRYRIFELLTSGRLAIIGLMRAIMNRDPKELIFGVRAWIDGLRLGAQIVKERGRINIYAAPILRTSRMQAVFARFSQESTRLILRRHRKNMPSVVGSI